MRPSKEHEDASVYECADCGERTNEPDTRLCGECGGELIDLGLSRDL
jgi:hypothetical protein